MNYDTKLSMVFAALGVFVLLMIVLFVYLMFSEKEEDTEESVDQNQYDDGPQENGSNHSTSDD